MEGFIKFAVDHLGGVSLIVTCLLGVLGALYKAHVNQRLLELKGDFGKEVATMKAIAATQLAQVEGDIRQRIETNLRYEESRLRIIAEVELRMHARQLEDLSASRWKTTHARLGVDRFLFQHHRGAGVDGLKPMPAVEEAVADAMGAAVLAPARHRQALLAYVDALREVIFTIDEAVASNKQADAAALNEMLTSTELRARSAFDAWTEELTLAHAAILKRFGSTP